MSATKEQIEAIGRTMHEQWSQQKRVQGFHGPEEPCPRSGVFLCSPDGKRCSAFHPNLVPWEQLPKAQKDINRHALDAALAASLVVLPQEPASSAAIFDLAAFSQVNLRRCIEGFGHTLESWSEAEWTNALAGEAGEAANIAKKMIRFRDAVKGNKSNDSYESLRQKLGRELADVVIYADLTAQRIGLSLSACVRTTFNAKSDELGCGIKFESEPLPAPLPAEATKRRPPLPGEAAWHDVIKSCLWDKDGNEMPDAVSRIYDLIDRIVGQFTPAVQEIILPAEAEAAVKRLHEYTDPSVPSPYPDVANDPYDARGIIMRDTDIRTVLAELEQAKTHARMTICSYCGCVSEAKDESWEAKKQSAIDHILVCEKHPLHWMEEICKQREQAAVAAFRVRLRDNLAKEGLHESWCDRIMDEPADSSALDAAIEQATKPLRELVQTLVDALAGFSSSSVYHASTEHEFCDLPSCGCKPDATWNDCIERFLAAAEAQGFKPKEKA